jgi:hypothetical protein
MQGPLAVALFNVLAGAPSAVCVDCVAELTGRSQFELGCGHGQRCLHVAFAMALAGCYQHGGAQVAVMAHCWHLGAGCTG